MLPARYLEPITLVFHCLRLDYWCARLSSHLASDSFRASCQASYRWINREADSSDKYLIYSEGSLTSVEDRVDGLRETSEAIASECDVTFELYHTFENNYRLV